MKVYSSNIVLIRVFSYTLGHSQISHIYMKSIFYTLEVAIRLYLANKTLVYRLKYFYVPCIGAGGGGRIGGTVQIGGPFTDKAGLEKSSSEGFVKEVLIWQHRALILPSPSPGSPMSMSDRQGGNRTPGRREVSGDTEKRKRQKLFIHVCNGPS